MSQPWVLGVGGQGKLVRPSLGFTPCGGHRIWGAGKHIGACCRTGGGFRVPVGSRGFIEIQCYLLGRTETGVFMQLALQTVHLKHGRFI